MNELRKSLISEEKFAPKEGQRELLRSSKDSLRCPSFGVNELKQEIFSDEELENISKLCFVFKKIRSRLISEGYSIEDLQKKLYEQKTGRKNL